MSEKRRSEEEGRLGPDEIEIDSDRAEDIEAAMREALEAVEKTEAGEPEPAAAEEVAEGNELAQLRAEIAELRDRSIRTLADFENFRKRSERERREQRQYAGFELLQSLLPVVDNLERALDAEGSAEDLKQGVGLILRQLQDLLRSFGVERIEAEGRPFDPTVHDAVTRHEEPGVSVPTVQEELLAGYLMRDRLLRAASVRVSVPPEEPRTDEGEEKPGLGDDSAVGADREELAD